MEMNSHAHDPMDRGTFSYTNSQPKSNT